MNEVSMKNKVEGLSSLSLTMLSARMGTKDRGLTKEQRVSVIRAIEKDVTFACSQILQDIGICSSDTEAIEKLGEDSAKMILRHMNDARENGEAKSFAEQAKPSVEEENIEFSADREGNIKIRAAIEQEFGDAAVFDKDGSLRGIAVNAEKGDAARAKIDEIVARYTK